jgi:hypothetical protein
MKRRKDGVAESMCENASVSSDRSGQRGSRFIAQGKDPNKEGILFASSAVRFSAETDALITLRMRILYLIDAS